ncbi:hypothetical protein [Butyrivibrio proteoclasticus]|uniref:hypothetical protein n=1 Tax=Butyrivibrio proteoclasticus TaxID=43305 RepID=UPI000479B0F5|nr:hypothetical protein [Butyrivibrio proteoclasticus]
MKKKFVVRLLAMTMASTLLSGCGISYSIKNEDEEAATEESTEEEEEEKEEEAEEEPEEEEADTENLTGEELYDAFMNGDVKITYTNLDVNGSADMLADYLEDGEEYDINEIAKKAEEGYTPGRTLTEDPTSRLIDCGEDGVKELLVRFQFGDSTSLSMILKDVDGKLKYCYSGESWDRSELCISDTGVITSSGSGGATVHGSDYAYVDAEGDYHFFYYVEDEGMPYSMYVQNDAGEYVTINFDDLDTDYFMVTSYRIEDDQRNTQCYYTYNMLDDGYNIITTDEDFAESNPYMQKFTEAGITIYKKDAIVEKLSKRAEEIGYPEWDQAVSANHELTLVAMEHSNSSMLNAEEQTCKDNVRVINGDPAVISDYVDGYKGSSWDGRLEITKMHDDNYDINFTFKLGSKYVGYDHREQSNNAAIDYLQVMDINGDGQEEILVVTYTISTATYVAYEISVWSYNGSEFVEEISFDDISNLIDGNDELAGATITYAGLCDQGLKIIADKGEKINGVYYPDEYELIVNY